MATQHFSSALPAPAASRPYRRAQTGYGKQSVPGQGPPGVRDFAFLPERERYVASYVDNLPDGAAMDIKSLAKDLPLYGQMAIGTALRALALAGHLRRVRRQVAGGGPCRWVTRTFWSRTAHDNEWWTARLEAEAAASEQPSAGAPASEQPCADAAASEAPRAPFGGPESEPAVPRQRTAESAPGAPAAPENAPDAAAAGTEPAGTEPTATEPAATEPAATEPAATDPTASEPAATDPTASEPAVTTPAVTAEGAVAAPPAAAAGPSPAYLALAELGRREPRLALSAADCEVLEPLAAAWFARGVSAGYLTSALTAGLPEQVGSPVGLVRRRLTDKMPPRLPEAPTPPPGPGVPDAPVRGLLVECTDCGRPGRAEALPDGLCAPCRSAHQAPETTDPDAAPEECVRDVTALVANLRNLMRTP